MGYGTLQGSLQLEMKTSGTPLDHLHWNLNKTLAFKIPLKIFMIA